MNHKSRIYHITTEFLDALRTEKRLMGVDKHVQIQTILQQLPDETDVETLKLTLIPLIAQSPQEQEQLYTVFDQAVKRVEELERIKTSEESGSSSNNDKNLPRVCNPWKVVATVVIVLSLLIGGGMWWKSTQQPTPIDTPTPTDSTQVTSDTLKTTQIPETTEGASPSYFVENKPYPFPDHLEKYSLKPPSPMQEWLSNNWAWLRWLLALAWLGILVGLWYYLAWKRRKLVAKHDTKEKPPYIWNINIEGIEPVEMGNNLDRVTQMLRNRAQSETQRLDMERTVNATIEQGGLPTFKYKRQTRPTDYLLLIDRQSVRNHRAKLFDSLYDVFKAQEIEIARFFYDSDVRVCYSEDYPHGIALADVQQRYYQSRLLIVGTGGQLLNPMSGKVAAWTAVFNQWKDRALFSPKPLTAWGYDERQLSALFTTLPATLQGLGFWVEEVAAGEDARFEGWQEKIDDVPNAPIIPDDNDPLPMLDLYFEPDVVKWIAACAIYPTLHWDLTLWLGQEVKSDTFKAKSEEIRLFTEGGISKAKGKADGASSVATTLNTFANLTQITRLSWFVTGEMPNETRDALLNYLEKEDKPLLTHLRGAMAVELMKNPPPEDSAAYDKFRLNIALNQWLATTDADEKAKLEKEVAALLEQGAEPDFTVIKYLNAPRTALDFIVPDAWKKFVYPSGYAALGWLKGWKDLVWVLALLVLGLVGVFYPYDFVGYDCSKDKMVQFIVSRTSVRDGGSRTEVRDTISATKDTTRYFCLDNPLSAMVYHEQFVHKAIEERRFNDTAGFSLPNKYATDSMLAANLLVNTKDLKDSAVLKLLHECSQNMAIDLFRLAVRLSKNNQKDSVCWALQKAFEYDSLNNDIQQARRDFCSIKPSANIVFEQDFEPYKANGLYGYRDRKTKKNLIPPQYQVAERFKNGVARVKIKATDNWFCIDKTGKTVDCVAQSLVNTPSVSTPQDSTNGTVLAPVMVAIKGGSFQMGSDESEDEKPIHRVTLSDFSIGKYEVTVEQFAAFINDNAYKTDADKQGSSYVWTGSSYEEKKGVNWKCDVSGKIRPKEEYTHPVIHVSWNDATAYAQWLSNKTSKKYRLPTEAEWEYACRAGTNTPFNTGENLTTDQANYNGNYPYKNFPKGKYLEKTTPVGSFAPNAWGLYDMHGNVYEWCSDWYDADYYKKSAAQNPNNSISSSIRVLRGGSWNYRGQYCRSAYRNYYAPAYRFNTFGFRLVFVP